MEFEKDRESIWVSKDGRETRICDMQDEHLVHTVLLIERLRTDNPHKVRIGFNVIDFYYPIMQKEIDFRSIRKMYYIKQGDIRGIVLATAELHGGKNDSQTHGKKKHP